MPKDKPLKEIKKTGEGQFEKTITREEKQFINKDLLLREKTSLEARLQEVNEDLAEIEKLEPTTP